MAQQKQSIDKDIQRLKYLNKLSNEDKMRALLRVASVNTNKALAAILRNTNGIEMFYRGVEYSSEFKNATGFTVINEIFSSFLPRIIQSKFTDSGDLDYLNAYGLYALNAFKTKIINAYNSSNERSEYLNDNSRLLESIIEEIADDFNNDKNFFNDLVAVTDKKIDLQCAYRIVNKCNKENVDDIVNIFNKNISAQTNTNFVMDIRVKFSDTKPTAYIKDVNITRVDSKHQEEVDCCEILKNSPNRIFYTDYNDGYPLTMDLYGNYRDMNNEIYIGNVFEVVNDDFIQIYDSNENKDNENKDYVHNEDNDTMKQ